MLVAGYFNADLAQPEVVERDEDIAAALAEAALEDILSHFLPQQHPWCQDGSMWSMVQLGREVWSQIDYILGTDRCLFRNVSIRDPRHNSDHYMILGCLCSATLREHTNCLGRRTRLYLVSIYVKYMYMCVHMCIMNMRVSVCGYAFLCFTCYFGIDKY